MCLSGRIYDVGLGPLLESMKRRVAHTVRSRDLYPALDLCTGTGRMCRLLSRPGKMVCGLDWDQDLLKYARARVPGVPFICADAARIPFGPGVFGACIVSYALHDKDPETRRAMLEEARRVLKPEGRLLVIDFENPWDRTSRYGGAFVSAIERLAGSTHYRNGRWFLRRGGLRAFLSDQGVEELESLSLPYGSSRFVIARFAPSRVRPGPRNSGIVKCRI